jgi:predicted RNA-binding protein with RPS1 domain
MPFEAGRVYRGKIVACKDFGFFVRIKDEEARHEREGLVHVGQIKAGGPRLERPQDSGYQIGDSVYAKVTQIRDDGKLSLSMKQVDQASGSELERNDAGRKLLQNSLAKIDCFDAEGRRVGPITGILLEDSKI